MQNNYSYLSFLFICMCSYYDYLSLIVSQITYKQIPLEYDYCAVYKKYIYKYSWPMIICDHVCWNQPYGKKLKAERQITQISVKFMFSV